jgi:hypothetical protein
VSRRTRLTNEIEGSEDHTSCRVRRSMPNIYNLTHGDHDPSDLPFSVHGRTLSLFGLTDQAFAIRMAKSDNAGFLKTEIKAKEKPTLDKFLWSSGRFLLPAFCQLLGGSEDRHWPRRRRRRFS